MLSYITWTASPLIFSGLGVRWYGLMFAIGFLVGYYIVDKMFKREGLPEQWVSSLFFLVIIATIVGARLGHVFFYNWSYYKNHLSEIPMVWEGGLASHGGVIGIMIAIWLYSIFVTKRSMIWAFDRLVVPIGFVAALIRLGNLMNHEIYGCATSQPWGFRFIKNVSAYVGGAEPVFTPPCHPTQLYEALCYLAIFGLCMWLYWKKNAQCRRGLLFGVFMSVLFTCRFFIEYLKNVQEPWEESMRASIGLDQGQVLSIPFILLGVFYIIYALCRPPKPLELAEKKEEKPKK